MKEDNESTKHFPVCRHFRMAFDKHDSCQFCRSKAGLDVCSQDAPCEVCAVWTQSQWAMFLKRVQQREKTKASKTKRKSAEPLDEDALEVHPSDESSLDLSPRGKRGKMKSVAFPVRRVNLDHREASASPRLESTQFVSTGSRGDRFLRTGGHPSSDLGWDSDDSSVRVSVSKSRVDPLKSGTPRRGLSPKGVSPRRESSPSGVSSRGRESSPTGVSSRRRESSPTGVSSRKRKSSSRDSSLSSVGSPVRDGSRKSVETSARGRTRDRAGGSPRKMDRSQPKSASPVRDRRQAASTRSPMGRAGCGREAEVEHSPSGVRGSLTVQCSPDGGRTAHVVESRSVPSRERSSPRSGVERASRELSPSMTPSRDPSRDVESVPFRASRNVEQERATASVGVELQAERRYVSASGLSVHEGVHDVEFASVHGRDVHGKTLMDDREQYVDLANHDVVYMVPSVQPVPVAQPVVQATPSAASPEFMTSMMEMMDWWKRQQSSAPSPVPVSTSSVLPRPTPASAAGSSTQVAVDPVPLESSPFLPVAPSSAFVPVHESSMDTSEPEDYTREEYRAFRDTVTQSRADFRVLDEDTLPSAVDFGPPDANARVVWSQQGIVSRCLQSLHRTAQSVKEDSAVVDTPFMTPTSHQVPFKSFTVKNCRLSNYKCRFDDELPYGLKPPTANASAHANFASPTSYSVPHSLITSTEELLRRSVQYQGVTDALVDTLWNDLPDDFKTVHKPLMKLYAEMASKSCTGALAAASNLQLVRRDAALSSLNLRPEILSRARTAPFTGSSIIGPKPDEFDERLYRAQERASVQGSSPLFKIPVKPARRPVSTRLGPPPSTTTSQPFRNRSQGTPASAGSGSSGGRRAPRRKRTKNFNGPSTPGASK